MRPLRAPLLALLAALAVAGVVLAAEAVGALAFALCAPAAAAAALAARRVAVREDRLRLLATTDPLTGAGNARLLRERLTYEVARHRRHERRLAVVVLDLDGFKAVNDRFGHPTGDEVLRDVARALGRATREQDTVVRQGGDEFCVVAPETGHAQAAVLAARLERAVAGAVGGLAVGSSVGWAVFPDDAGDAETLVERADAAQGRAKRRGRGAAVRPAA